MKTPTPEQVTQARKDAGLTQTQAAKVLGVSLRAWQYWENGGRTMSAANYELFMIKVGL